MYFAKKNTKSRITFKIHQVVLFKGPSDFEIDGKRAKLHASSWKNLLVVMSSSRIMRVLPIEISRKIVSSAECLSFFMPFSLSKPREVAATIRQLVEKSSWATTTYKETHLNQTFQAKHSNVCQATRASPNHPQREETVEWLPNNVLMAESIF